MADTPSTQSEKVTPDREPVLDTGSASQENHWPDLHSSAGIHVLLKISKVNSTGR